MKFSEVVEQAGALLQRKGRITYRALQREFRLDEQALQDLKDELIDAEQVEQYASVHAASFSCVYYWTSS